MYFLFDIDGTLLLSGGAGRHAMTQVMNEMYQLTELARLEVHGRTDRGIIADLFAKHDIPLTDEIRKQFSERYHQLLPESLKACDGQMMPGVVPLLDWLTGLPNVHLGLLTGNSKVAAWAKLKHFGLDGYFQDFGGFGDDHAARDDVAGQALASIRTSFGDDSIPGSDAWIIGDTIHDITCSRSINANVIAVETGGVDPEELSRYSPDRLLVDLTDISGFAEATSLDCVNNRP